MPSTAFIKTDHRRIEGLNLDFHAFEHRATGARHFHLDCDDPNNAFMIAFPTGPAEPVTELSLNSVGVAGPQSPLRIKDFFAVAAGLPGTATRMLVGFARDMPNALQAFAQQTNPQYPFNN